MVSELASSADLVVLIVECELQPGKAEKLQPRGWGLQYHSVLTSPPNGKTCFPTPEGIVGTASLSPLLVGKKQELATLDSRVLPKAIPHQKASHVHSPTSGSGLSSGHLWAHSLLFLGDHEAKVTYWKLKLQAHPGQLWTALGHLGAPGTETPLEACLRHI